MRKVNNPCNRSYKHHCFLPGGNNTSPSLMFLSLKLDIGRHEPTIKHNAPSWSCNLLLGQSNKRQRRTCKNTQEQKYKGKPNILLIKLNIISYRSDPSKHNIEKQEQYKGALIVIGSSQGLTIEAQDWREDII